MIGAIVGDVVESRFDWHNRKSKQFTLLKGRDEDAWHFCHFTDDSVMTLAVADAIMKWRGGDDSSYAALSAEAVKSMQAFGRRYPDAGYGGAFWRWLDENDPQPYNSWGNGAAMRVSACGWAGRTLDEVKALSRAVFGFQYCKVLKSGRKSYDSVYDTKVVAQPLTSKQKVIAAFVFILIMSLLIAVFYA